MIQNKNDFLSFFDFFILEIRNIEDKTRDVPTAIFNISIISKKVNKIRLSEISERNENKNKPGNAIQKLYAKGINTKRVIIKIYIIE